MSPTLSDSEGPQLVVVPNVGMVVDGDRAFLDIKAVEGLRLYAELWPGPVLCIGRQAAAGSFGYGAWYQRDELPFAIACVGSNAGADEIAALCGQATLVLGGADSHLDLGLVERLAPISVVLIIEYTLKTRLDMLRFERRSALQKLKTGLWLLRTERPRRRALRQAAAIQANGTPAFRNYRRPARDDLLYFDTRLKRSLAIDAEAADSKAMAVASGAPLRLAFSGRLETIKGADQLVPVLAAVHRRGSTNATIAIFGDGSLRGEIQRQAEQAGLSAAVLLHGPIDFETELVPTLRNNIDLFVCCHPQADPSCTYLETLGCGVPIAGYRNAALAGVLELGDCGVAVPIGDVEGLGTAIASLDRDRPRLATLTRAAASISADNLFEDVFRSRVRHLCRIALPGRDYPALATPTSAGRSSRSLIM